MQSPLRIILRPIMVLAILFDLAFALAAPPDSADTDKATFMESIYCARCHANSSRAVAMRDRQERGIAPYDLWQSTAMANSSRDPFWLAVLSAEVAATPSLKGAIEEKCTRCHAPMAAPAPESPAGQLVAHLRADDQRGWLGREGVSCTLCHQIRDVGLGDAASFTGHFRLGPKGPIFGPHAEPFTMPMQHHTGYTPTHSMHMLKAGLCATCHTLITDAVHADATPTGDRLHEQSPYLEWRNSVYNHERVGDAAAAKSCQDCHMPTTDDDGRPLATRIAHNPGGRDFPFLRARTPFGQHTFFGGNVFLTQILLEHREKLGVQAPAGALRARLQAARAFLENKTARLAIGSVERLDQRLRIPVTVTNLAGHKLPTAYPSRRVWLRIEVRGPEDQLLFGSGRYDDAGRLLDADENVLPSELAAGPILPHFHRIDAADRVQVYQSVMADSDGQPTFTLLRGAGFYKDDRLLPRGWRADHADARATAPVGLVNDPDFAEGSDTVIYEPTVIGQGPYRVQVWLHYQVLSPRHAAELFRYQTAEVKAFRQLYESTTAQPETLATASASAP
jgi:hypothetical protein